VNDEQVVQLRTALGRIVRRLDRQISHEGRPRTQLSILATVATHKIIGMGQLADIEGINPTMLSRIVGRLEDDGLVRRVPDPDDRRAVQVEITASGTRFHTKLRRERTRLLTEKLQLLPPAQRQALMAALPALDSLAAALQQPTPAEVGR
jgi:DNA-binding MarR family transcriptional regulator